MSERERSFFDCTLLSVEQAAAGDVQAERLGIASFDLMSAAGRALADAVCDLCPEGRVAVLCGPGNNGGDGLVAARLLAQEDRDVRLALLGSRDGLTGDAARAALQWVGPVSDFETMMTDLSDVRVVVDAVFGAGLSRPVEGVAARIFSHITALGLPVVAADMPSGINGDSGQICGTPCPATVTVTFCRPKTGHYLLPGRDMCGRLIVADIGIPVSAIESVAPRQWINTPALWQNHVPRLSSDDHKYKRGVLALFGSQEMSGAARLAAQAARRVGAGLARVGVPSSALMFYAHDPGLLTVSLDDLEQQQDFLSEPRHTAYVIGPGNGQSPLVHHRVLGVLGTGRPCVLDADALSVFAGDSTALCAAITSTRRDCVLTPHEGEFHRLFAENMDVVSGKLVQARWAAQQMGATIVLKGSDTVIAGPDGRAAINANAPPWLATGGSGDVLAGLIGGLLAQRMPAFEAACAGVWIHGAAAQDHGPGMIAEDLPESIPAVLRRLIAQETKDLTAEDGPSSPTGDDQQTCSD